MSYSELAGFYSDDYWGGDSSPTADWIRRSQAEKTGFLDSCGLTGGRILDVGCGSGFFLRALDSGKWERFGVETGTRAAALARTHLGESNVFAGTLLDARFDQSFFDVVTFWSALEHTNEPRENLDAARQILRPGGTLIVQLPNAGSYQLRAFKGAWFALDAPRHRYHFTRETLTALLHRTGFEPYRLSFRSREHNSHALRQSLKTRLLADSRSALHSVLFYLSVPLLKPFDLAMSAGGRGATITLAAKTR
jgi:2-polyprenyl-3-methyl-5-hydroxy-6-metoxy-1,4-benzoquinol methylase